MTSGRVLAIQSVFILLIITLNNPELNAQGSLVLEDICAADGPISVNTSHLPAGVYFLRVGPGHDASFINVVKIR